MAKKSKLSEEMVVQILSRLPPKSLMRFRCVHKLWNDLINSPSFVAKHLANSKSMHSEFALVKRTIFNVEIKDEQHYKSIIFDPNSDKKEILLSTLNLSNLVDDGGDDRNLVDHVDVEDFRLPSPMDQCSLSIQIVGHCDGIICLKHYDRENVVLCNPALKEFKLLPKSEVHIPDFEPPEYDSDGNEVPDGWYDFEPRSTTNCVGFGYDSKSKEYKVVRVVEIISGICSHDASKVEIFTVGGDIWREIKCDVPSHAYWSPSFQLHHKGIYYWWAKAVEEKEVILSFNFTDELFHDIDVPENVEGPENVQVDEEEWIGFYRSLVVWKESVVLMVYKATTGPKSIDMWKLDEDYHSGGGVSKCPWTKHVTIGPIDGVAIPLNFWKNNELLMVDKDGHVVSYNLDTQKLKNLRVHGVEGNDHIQAVNYVNSILSVHGSN